MQRNKPTIITTHRLPCKAVAAVAGARGYPVTFVTPLRHADRFIVPATVKRAKVVRLTVPEMDEENDTIEFLAHAIEKRERDTTLSIHKKDGTIHPSIQLQYHCVEHADAVIIIGNRRNLRRKPGMFNTMVLVRALKRVQKETMHRMWHFYDGKWYRVTPGGWLQRVDTLPDLSVFDDVAVLTTSLYEDIYRPESTKRYRKQHPKPLEGVRNKDDYEYCTDEEDSMQVPLSHREACEEMLYNELSRLF